MNVTGEDIGKLLVLGGLVMAMAGSLVWGLARIGFRGLPGDIRYETEHVRIYVPVITCLAVSLLASLLVWLWQWLGRR